LACWFNLHFEDIGCGWNFAKTACFFTIISIRVPDLDLHPDLHVFSHKYGSFPFLKTVLSGLKKWFHNKTIQKFSPQIHFYNFEAFKLKLLKPLKNLKKYFFASGSVSHRYGSEDLDPHPDPYQNVTGPEHCFQF